MEFKKATLQEISSQPSAPPPCKEKVITVQINPATLRLQMANTADFGKDVGRPKTQYQGSTSTLSFDLVFDTADEGTTADPVDVRTRVRPLEQFLLPKKGNAKAAPPRVQFTYGTLTVVGVMSTLNVDYDFFSSNGVPLRAKCAVTIKEQKPEFDANLTGPGANTGAGATPPLPPAPGGLGAPAGPVPDRTAAALAGESAADFAARFGLDPRAWKDVVSANGILDPLRLEPGALLDFAASASIGASLGSTSTPTALVPTSAQPMKPSTATPAAPPASGTDLTAAGGLSRALDRATVARTATAASATRAAFASATPSASSQPAPSSTAAAAAPAPAAAVVTVDPRAATYGFGVPLRERVTIPGPASAALVRVRDRRLLNDAGDGVPVTDDPTMPGWLALSASPKQSSAVTAVRRSKPCSCGCGKVR